MKHRNKLKQAKRLVVKIGSSLLTAQGQGLDHNAIADWVKQIATLHKEGVQVLLVSSGAVAEGMMRMGWSKRPHALYELQAAAAIGQMGLIQTYESFFKQHDIHTAQVLLTHDDLSHRKRYLNARTTLKTLLDLGVIPVINENDTVTTDEFRFGDNDSLAALVVNLVEADALVLLTDQAGVYDKDPRNNGDAQFSDIAQLSNMASTDWSWSNLIADFDNDGWKDVYITNGLMRDIRNTDAARAFSKEVESKIYDFIVKNPTAENITIWDVVDIEKALKINPSVKLSNYVYKKFPNVL